MTSSLVFLKDSISESFFFLSKDRKIPRFTLGKIEPYELRFFSSRIKFQGSPLEKSYPLREMVHGYIIEHDLVVSHLMVFCEPWYNIIMFKSFLQSFIDKQKNSNAFLVSIIILVGLFIAGVIFVWKTDFFVTPGYVREIENVITDIKTREFLPKIKDTVLETQKYVPKSLECLGVENPELRTFIHDLGKYRTFIHCSYSPYIDPISLRESPRGEYWGIYDTEADVYYYLYYEAYLAGRLVRMNIFDVLNQHIFIGYCYEGSCGASYLVNLSETEVIRGNEKRVKPYGFRDVMFRNNLQALVVVNQKVLLIGEHKIAEMNPENFNITVLKEIPSDKLFGHDYNDMDRAFYPDYSIERDGLRYRIYDKKAVEDFEFWFPRGIKDAPKPVMESEGFLKI